MSDSPVTVVVPCLNEASSLPGVLTAIPAGYHALVVDNNSTDGTADVARAHEARVVAESNPGYGAAVHAGIVAADTPIVAVLESFPRWWQNSTEAPTWRWGGADPIRG